MMRQTIEDYLDGELDAQGRSAAEQALATDAGARALLETLRAQRKLRASVYDSYMPSQEQAASLASQILAACENEAATPVGKITPATSRWLRYGTGIAAAIAVAVTAFGVGRMTAPAGGSGTQTPGGEKSSYVYVVPVKNLDESSPKVFRLASAEEAETKIRELQAPPEPLIADAGDLGLPGQL